MVMKNSIYYGRFDGFKAPMVPKAPRSLRVNSHKKSSKNSKLCAFELLAAVAAEKLLQESESSTSSTIQEQITVPVVKQEEPKVKVKVNLKEPPESDNDSGLEHVSDVKTSDFVSKVGNNVKLEPSDGKIVKFESIEKQNGELTFSNIKMMGITDDDENSYRFSQRVNKISTFRSRSRVGYRKLRKMLTSRYHKVTAKNDYGLTNSTSGVKPVNRNRKNIYKHETCEIDAASKRRKLFHHNSSNTSNKVKFSINSFEVPEIYVELPETATIGSLKRTVMEAVRAILGDELHVGILLEGKKVKDNNRTLQQSGISQNCDLGNLGFTLEPSFPQLSLPHETSQRPSSSTASPITEVGFSNSCLDLVPQATNLENYVDKNQEIISLQNEVLTEERVTDLKAREGVDQVNLKQIKKFEVGQRRIRRPFSVSEVEALVEAVETLGTGRWRDVKMRSFDVANHRTYVDLKDKWKTLVHTANIAPQQRRGEPVPQDLLDRVLVAHGYWSNHQSKQQRKHQGERLRIMDDSSVEFVGI